MRFLIDEDLPRSAGDLLRQYGHEAIDVRDIGLRGSKDPEIAAYAQKNGLSLLTGDFDFSDIRKYPPKQYNGLVDLKIPAMTTAVYILNCYLRTKTDPPLPDNGPRAKLLIMRTGRGQCRCRGRRPTRRDRPRPAEIKNDPAHCEPVEISRR